MPNSKLQRAYDDDLEDQNFAPLTADQARTWREKNPAVSPWRLTGWQLCAAVLTALVAAGVSGKMATAWSALWGSMAVIVPSALFAKAMLSRAGGQDLLAFALRLLVWEVVKLVLCVALLAAASWLIEDLSWPAMLVGLVVALKVYWLALLLRSKPKQI